MDQLHFHMKALLCLLCLAGLHRVAGSVYYSHACPFKDTGSSSTALLQPLRELKELGINKPNKLPVGRQEVLIEWSVILWNSHGNLNQRENTHHSVINKNRRGTR